jgi:predicted RNA polymerase sigma factor
MTAAPAEDVLRELAPQVLGALVRRYGHFDTAEDVVQEALLEMAGEQVLAAAHHRAAAAATTSGPEQRYLLARAQRLGTGLP